MDVAEEQTALHFGTKLKQVNSSDVFGAEHGKCSGLGKQAFLPVVLLLSLSFYVGMVI